MAGLVGRWKVRPACRAGAELRTKRRVRARYGGWEWMGECLGDVFEGVREEQLVLPDRAARIAAERVDVRRRPPHPAAIIVEGVGIQVRVLEELEKRSVILVGSALGND